LPDKWMNKLDSFQRIIVIKCLRPDKVTNSMQDFVAENIGQRFIEPQVIHLFYINIKINVKNVLFNRRLICIWCSKTHRLLRHSFLFSRKAQIQLLICTNLPKR
jgi:hypothetical protein